MLIEASDIVLFKTFNTEAHNSYAHINYKLKTILTETCRADAQI